MKTNRATKKQSYWIELDPATYTKLIAISLGSRMPINQLLALAINLWDASTQHLNARHAPPTTLKPLNADRRAAAIAAPRPKRTKPTSIGRILKKMYNNKKG